MTSDHDRLVQPGGHTATVTGSNAGAARAPGPPAAPDDESGDGQQPAQAPERGVPAQAPEPGLSAQAPGPGAEPANSRVPQLWSVLGRVVAPTTLLTALLYYFGWAHAYYFFGYFGVNSTVLGFSTVDYLMRSVDALFVPVTAGAIIALFAMWGHAALAARIAAEPGRRAYDLLMRGITAGGLALTIAGGVLTFVTKTALGQYVALAPVGFAAGVLLTAYAVHLRRVLAGARGVTPGGPASGWAAATEWMIAFALVGISLFAAATDYAAAVGQSRARHFASVLWTQPGVALYSARSLSLDLPGVTQVRCRDPQAAYRYRYDGLKLVLESGGKYLLLPQEWTPANGAAILIAQSDPIRLEFYPSSDSIGSRAAC